jgi:tRNA (guanine37-N1)-methyltransferase
MKIDVLTIFPDLFEAVLKWGVISRAIESGLIEFGAVDLRDFTDDRHRTTDDYPFGGGGGLVMKAGPILRAVDALKANGPVPYVIYTSPQGEIFDNARARELSRKKGCCLSAEGTKG